MCGLAGIVAPRAAALENALRAMTDAQRHRGPDGAGIEWRHLGGISVGLGHRRLAVQDVSASGHQPMVAPETGNLLAFNGEIYNAAPLRAELQRAGVRFSGHSDTEVLLKGLDRWGSALLPRLEGMYAFAWLEPAARTLTLARDPLGIKPLYVCRDGARLLFASEVRALLASGMVGTELAAEGLASLLAYGAVQAPHTLFRHIEVFPAGCVQRMVLAADGCLAPAAPVPHWRFPAPTSALTRADAVQQLRAGLAASVQSHLVSDVPLAVFLSSGIDSTLVGALAARAQAELRAYTVGFPEDADHSEAELAAETAGLFGLRHETLWFDRANALGNVLPWLDSQDQPCMDGLNTYLISSCVREAGVIVALSGQGADELYGGYPSFTDVPRLLRGLQRAGAAPASWRRAGAWLLSRGRDAVFREKLRDMATVGADVVALALQRRRCFSNRQVAALLPRAARDGGLTTSHFIATRELESLPACGDDAIALISAVEARFYLGNTLLPVGDSAGMAHGLEIRVPMLDRPLLDLACSLPGALRLPEGRADKSLLRAAFPEYLRPALAAQRKRGFVLPLQRWMQGPLRPVSEAALAVLRRHPQFGADAVDAVWQGFLRSPETPGWSRAWLLVALGHYLGRMQA